MKNKALLLIAAGALTLTGCGTGSVSDNSIPSIGKPYELFVVTPKTVWDGPAGDTTRSIFSDEVSMINQPEPIFDLLSVPPQNFKTTVIRQRNILILKVGKDYTQSDMTAEYNANATPQLQVTVTSPSMDSLAAYLNTYRTQLVKLYEIAERDRFVAKANAFQDKKIGTLIQQKFGFTMSIPDGYKVRNDTTNFLWISYELPLASVGFIIYTYPADTSATINNKAGNILAARNAAVMQVPGPSDGSYMTTNSLILPDQKLVTISGRQWNQLRGLWDVEGDFMGGPFINYTTYDKANKRMIGIDGYVFSPSPNNNTKMRNYVRQVEAIFMTVNVPN